MNLFMAAGVDLPSSGSSGKRAPRLQRTALIAEKAYERALATKAIAPTPEQIALGKKYAKRAQNAAFRSLKETAARPIFFDEVLCGILGYKRFSEDSEYSFKDEKTLRGKPVDAALGRFFPDGQGDQVVAPFEAKGPDTLDVEKIMPGRGISPVQQAWDYAADAPGARWVLVTNCLEIRLYRFGRGRDAYELFDLTRLDENEQLRRLLLVLEAERLIGRDTEALLEESDSALKAVTDDLYADYKRLRGELVAFLSEAADGPKLPLPKAIETAQKLLDRVIFVAFASGNGMLPQNIFMDAVKQRNEFDPKPVWQNVRQLFRWVDKGNHSPNPRFEVWPYNGGLFAEDPLADTVTLPDHLSEAVAGLVGWDYGKEVSVNVLGHIFEQSIGDIEKLRKGEQPAISQRKREGVVYTPDHVTRFLVEYTLGETLKERFNALLIKHVDVDEPGEEGNVPWDNEATECAFWNDYLTALRDITVVDPACGSGAFLVAAFDALAAEYRRVTDRLADLGERPGFDIYDEILSRNLYGVDLNIESAEITRLALWLKSARRQHRLAKLDQTIRAGNSLVDDPRATDRPFDWKAAFPEVFDKGGFDIVIGNPPYVRAELLKDIKPWLAKHYTVADDSTDLSAYFFERGAHLLKAGGRLGYISSSTFFRTGSGEKLRLLLSEHTDIETVVDFGDAQIFEGVTTYPAILTARKKQQIGAPIGELRFLKTGTVASGALGRAFLEGAKKMPRARLGGGSWQFEDDPLARLRNKIVKGRGTLGEIYGPPRYGIKTGLNDAFLIGKEIRDQLISEDAKAESLIKPFLRGEDAKRWIAEFSQEWIIFTNVGIALNEFPSIERYLSQYKDRLLPKPDDWDDRKPWVGRKAGSYEWYELQDTVAFWRKFEEPKIVFQDIALSNPFSIDEKGYYPANTCYFIDSGDYSLLAYLNSKLCWFFLKGQTNILRGGYLRLRTEFTKAIPIAEQNDHLKTELAACAASCVKLADDRSACRKAFRHRLLTDLAAPGVRLSRKLENFHELDFSEFRAEVKRALRAEIAVKERAEWEALHAEASAKVKSLTAEIAAAEREIDRLVYEAFELTAEEIALLEKSLEGQA